MQLRRTSQISLIIILAAFFLVTGCNRGATTTATSIPATETISPTLTSTPVANKVILDTSSETSSNLVQKIEPVLNELAGAAGLIVESKTNLQLTDVGSDVKLVLFPTTPAKITEFTNGAPQVQFIVITDQEIAPAGNLSVIRENPQDAAFIAGYITEMITNDWRGAGIIGSETSGSIEEQAFLNGGRYYCGICQPAYGPFAQFPLSGTLPAASDFSAWQAIANQLLSYRIYTFYVSKGAASSDLLVYLAAQQVLTEFGTMTPVVLLGEETPPDTVRGSWAATIQTDYVGALRSIWSAAVSGQGGQQASTGVVLADVNEQFLGVGKQRLVGETIQKLVDGLIDPLSIP